MALRKIAKRLWIGWQEAQDSLEEKVGIKPQELTFMRACRDEIIMAAEQQLAVKFSEIFLNDRRDDEINRARVAVEDLRKKGQPYIIDFFLSDDFSPLQFFPDLSGRKTETRKSVVGNKNNLIIQRFGPDHIHSIRYYRKDANEQIPEGFIKPPIGTGYVRNLETEEQQRAYLEKMFELQKETWEELKLEARAGLDEAVKKWEATPMEEWEKLAKQLNYTCGCDRGIVYKTDPDTQNPVDSSDCSICGGTGSLTAEILKRTSYPSYDLHTNVYPSTVEKVVKTKLKELGLTYPKDETHYMKVVYARILPK
jgi:hypothetical protein